MLKAMFKKIGKNKKGFTLIELLVVIAILGILAAILIPTVGGFMDSAKQKAADADAHTVYTAMVAYNAANAHTPVTSDTVYTLDNLKPYLGSNVNFTITSFTVTDSAITAVSITEPAASGGKVGNYPAH